MVDRVILNSIQYNNLVSLAKNTLPNESCAILVGKTSEKDVYIINSISMRNSDSSRITFSIDPQQLIEIYQTVEKQNMHVVGIFHSHPAEPMPSSIDKKFMEINPVVWIIYSTVTDESRAYIFEEKLVEVQMHIANSF
ncbi:MAG TPA: M67 family metallopeptidase [Nitrososphaeraceae archaeon]|jgi:proteasome lid subunit RPN8/RPN11|nr:M67 family metallopeptidase [Nitrososphaeraceae archaeon]